MSKTPPKHDSRNTIEKLTEMDLASLDKSEWAGVAENLAGLLPGSGQFLSLPAAAIGGDFKADKEYNDLSSRIEGGIYAQSKVSRGFKEKIKQLRNYGINNLWEAAAATGGALGGMSAAAYTGSAIGTAFFPGVGTVVGGIAGFATGMAGAVAGGMAGSKIYNTINPKTYQDLAAIVARLYDIKHAKKAGIMQDNFPPEIVFAGLAAATINPRSKLNKKISERLEELTKGETRFLHEAVARGNMKELGVLMVEFNGELKEKLFVTDGWDQSKTVSEQYAALLDKGLEPSVLGHPNDLPASITFDGKIAPLESPVAIMPARPVLPDLKKIAKHMTNNGVTINRDEDGRVQIVAIANPSPHLGKGQV